MVRDCVREGGSYLGVCFGAYLAGRDPGFDLLPGGTTGYVDLPDTTSPGGRDTVVPVTWRGKPRHMYFPDGPVSFLNKGAPTPTSWRPTPTELLPSPSSRTARAGSA